MGGVVLRSFPRVDAAGLWLVRRGRLCEDLCFGHDARGEIPRGALDSKDGSVHCSGVMVGVRCKGVGESCALMEGAMKYNSIRGERME